MFVDFFILFSFLFVVVRDCVFVNNVVIRYLRILYLNLVDIGCFSYIFDYVGEKMVILNFEKFMKLWVSFFVYSVCLRNVFKVIIGEFFKFYLEIRWWFKYEMMV